VEVRQASRVLNKPCSWKTVLISIGLFACCLTQTDLLQHPARVDRVNLIGLIVLVYALSCGAAPAQSIGAASRTAPTPIQPAPSYNSISGLLASDRNRVVQISGDCVMSEPASNIAVIFLSASHNASAFPSAQPIGVGFLSMTNRSYKILRLKPEYEYRLLMSDESGNVIPPKPVGARYGEKFNALKGFNASAVTRDRAFVSIATPEFPPPNKLTFPAPEVLFRLEKAGRYTLFVEAQCFCGSFPHTSTNLYLIRFPPVRIPVVKRDDN